MNDDQIRIAIAEWCGWHFTENGDPYKLNSTNRPVYFTKGMEAVPDYPNDLNAVHEAEGRLTDFTEMQTYLRKLKNIVAQSHEWEDLMCCWCITHATARQRCEALLKTIGKWKE
jgi:hypothetical protein